MLKCELHNDIDMKTIGHYQHDLCAWVIEGQTWKRCNANLSAAALKIHMKLVCSLEKVYESIISLRHANDSNNNFTINDLCVLYS